MSKALVTQNGIEDKLDKMENDSASSPFNGVICHDVLTALLADKRSFATKTTYEKSLKNFFDFAYGTEPSEKVISQFLGLGKFDAIRIVLRYKCYLIEKGLAEATVNLRLCVLRSFVAFAVKMGKCNWTLDDIKSEPVQNYRDTTGVKPNAIGDMLAKCDRQSLRGKRNYAILRLLWGNALRLNEIVSLNVGDFDESAKTLQILGKGQGSQETIITLDRVTADAIRDWLSCCDIREPKKRYGDRPLFVALDNNYLGHRLTGSAIYQIVCTTARSVGIRKPMSPHRIRHSAITAALDSTNGDVRKVQKFSRHKKLDTLMIYDDNRSNMQREISQVLSDMI